MVGHKPISLSESMKKKYSITNDKSRQNFIDYWNAGECTIKEVRYFSYKNF